MNILDLEPKKVFYYFSKISSIPHGSYHTQELANYCLEFAQEHNLRAEIDEAGNVVIFKDGTLGYEHASPVILQGHLDMVCEKRKDCMIDMERECITLLHDDTYVYADGTTLGGDDGIAIAYILAILDDNTLSHPPIEALLTNNEEVGLAGARDLKIQSFKGKRLINIDSEEEGVLTVSCAGAVRAYSHIPVQREKNQKSYAYRIYIHGLLGGHSGTDIHKNRENALCLMGRICTDISLQHAIQLIDVQGGKRENVICNEAVCSFVCDDDVLPTCKGLFDDIVDQLCGFESDLELEMERIESPMSCLTMDSSRKIIFALNYMPDGLIRINPEMEGMTRTSLNNGSFKIDEKEACFGCLIRSNMDSEKEMLKKRVQTFVEYLGGYVTYENDYPAWPYKIDSPLRTLMVKVYEEMTGVKPNVSSIHAGLECGILTGVLGELDMVSIGPDLMDVHTPNEKMSIASVQRVWKYLVKVLEEMRD